MLVYFRCSPGAEIIYGVHAHNKQTLIDMIDNHEFDNLFKRIPVNPGDFYYVPAGTVHAIGSGILIFETTIIRYDIPYL